MLLETASLQVIVSAIPCISIDILNEIQPDYKNRCLDDSNCCTMSLLVCVCSPREKGMRSLVMSYYIKWRRNSSKFNNPTRGLCALSWISLLRMYVCMYITIPYIVHIHTRPYKATTNLGRPPLYVYDLPQGWVWASANGAANFVAIPDFSFFYWRCNKKGIEDGVNL